MKLTYSNKNFNWILTVVTLMFVLFHLDSLFFSYDIIAELFESIFYLLLALLAFLSLLPNKLNGEKFVLFYVTCFLLVVPLSSYAEYLMRVLKYGYSSAPFAFPVINLCFLLGILLTFFCNKFSMKNKDEIKRYYGFFFIIYGSYLFLKIILDDFNFMKFFDVYFIIQVCICFLVAFIGNRIATSKTKFLSGILLIALMLLILNYISLSNVA
ncbi:hypothetical protein [Soonwooa sp.]|uniref:hypothetical protein n=1 Tax=Soonwooa sp. TaxID=1938592 RepID=UPI0026057F66|nr:hypothetical protein [Soonwooa sp.]